MAKGQRVSTDKQDAQKQRHLLLQYAQQHKLLIDEFIEVEISSRRNTKERRIDELRAKLADGDTLIVAELSRLGRNMFETLNIINALGESGVRILFVRQPELSTDGPQTKLPLAWPSTATSPRPSASSSRCAPSRAWPRLGPTARRWVGPRAVGTRCGFLIRTRSRLGDIERWAWIWRRFGS